MTTPLLQVQDLTVHYPLRRGVADAVLRRPAPVVRAVDGVSFDVHRGEMVALVGESGSGKTTTAQAVLRLVDAVGGAVRFDGQDIAAIRPRQLRRMRRRMQIVYQDPYESLDPRLRVGDTVEEPLLVHGIVGDRRRAVHDALTRVGLEPAEMFARRYPHELSGGQRQRVAIAAALILGPQLLIADEPVSMLDVSVRADVLALLAGLRRDEGTAIVMITHDLSTAARFADRIAVMYLGRIVEEGPATDVIQQPRHPYTQALLSAVPHPDPNHRAGPRPLPGEPPNLAAIPAGCRFRPRCPVALDRCAAEDPGLTPVRSAGRPHQVACVLAN